MFAWKPAVGTLAAGTRFLSEVPGHIPKYGVVLLQPTDGTDTTPGSVLAHWVRCKTLLLNNHHDNLVWFFFFSSCILAVINWSDAISAFLRASPGASS